MFVSLKDKIKKIVYGLIPPPYVNESFSQAGEDCCMDFLFTELGMHRPSYLELGVCNPIIGSNTYRFYKKGARGVLVEADQTLIETIQKHRPMDTIIHSGITSGEKNEADFYIFDCKGYNTFVKEEAEYREKNSTNKIIRVEKVKLKSINDVIKNHFQGYPDLLSIDIEGLDYEVLKSLDYNKFPIPVICAETCTFSETHIKPKNKSIESLMTTKGYFVYADTYVNTIFVNQLWFNTVSK